MLLFSGKTNDSWYGQIQYKIFGLFIFNFGLGMGKKLEKVMIIRLAITDFDVFNVQLCVCCGVRDLNNDIGPLNFEK